MNNIKNYTIEKNLIKITSFYIIIYIKIINAIKNNKELKCQEFIHDWMVCDSYCDNCILRENNKQNLLRIKNILDSMFNL